MQRLKAGEIEGIDATSNETTRKPDLPAHFTRDWLNSALSRSEGLLTTDPETSPVARETPRLHASEIPARHMFQSAVAGYTSSCDDLIHAYRSAQAGELLNSVFRSGSSIQPNSALTQLRSIVAVGSTFLPQMAPIETARTFYSIAHQYLGSLLEEDALCAAKVPLMLACCQVDKRTEATERYISKVLYPWTD